MDAESIVIGNNSRTLQAGFGGEDAPRAVFPCVVGRYRAHNELYDYRPRCIGDDCYRQHGHPTITYPVDNGIITNWDDMERIWRYTFENELRVATDEMNVLLAETPLHSNREKLTQIMFETFRVSGLYLKNQDELSLYGSGNVTGLVFDSGATNSRATPIFDGHALLQAMCTTNIGGDDMTRLLVQDIFEEQQRLLQTKYELENARDIKENLCYVKGLTEQPKPEIYYGLADITLTRARYKCTEALFNPKLIGEIGSIQEVINKAIRKCDQQVWRDLSNNIILVGGNTMFEGLAGRLTEELNKISQVPVKIHAPPERKYLTWMGGSFLACLSTMRDMWITRDMYDEHGVGIVHRMCPQTSYLAESKLYTKPLNQKAFSDVQIR